ncbi:MAG: SDR family NAD(P)-dependent oxidoreductase [Candidatus Eremiobacteraeota bacterium]|nr:SDR family NAD(P)-dependent oxidoreductase [Candidatus Eremiobacteraeota bacterium]MBC5827608.1 SDR family NAD(P)-dependent oxidoreductase [Candidatus Eremiobacteraeota bacterium]
MVHKGKTRRALVTGGAGLIGSHIADRLIEDGWDVRVLDNLESQTHRSGRPAWAARYTDFIQADICDRSAVRAALDGVDTIFHEAAYGGYMPEIAKYVWVNSFGTAQMLEIIRDEKLPVRKVVVASSQAVYMEGAARCQRHGQVFPESRTLAQMTAGDFAVHCPRCGDVTVPIPTPENAPIGGQNVYAITKVDQERLVLTWSQQTGIPAVALRYSCTYGPRQSIFNPYTGVIAIFCTRLLNGQPVILYEDGNQTRDMVFVDDIARANVLVAGSDALDGRAVNVGSGNGVRVRDIAAAIGEAVCADIEPIARGEFRPGEMRHLTSDISQIESIGYKPTVVLGEGIERYLQWIGSQGDVHDYFAEAQRMLRAKGTLHRVTAATGGRTA